MSHQRAALSLATASAKKNMKAQFPMVLSRWGPYSEEPKSHLLCKTSLAATIYHHQKTMPPLPATAKIQTRADSNENGRRNRKRHDNALYDFMARTSKPSKCFLNARHKNRTKAHDGTRTTKSIPHAALRGGGTTIARRAGTSHLTYGGGCLA